MSELKGKKLVNLLYIGAIGSAAVKGFCDAQDIPLSSEYASNLGLFMLYAPPVVTGVGGMLASARSGLDNAIESISALEHEEHGTVETSDRRKILAMGTAIGGAGGLVVGGLVGALGVGVGYGVGYSAGWIIK